MTAHILGIRYELRLERRAIRHRKPPFGVRRWGWDPVPWQIAAVDALAVLALAVGGAL